MYTDIPKKVRGNEGQMQCGGVICLHRENSLWRVIRRRAFEVLEDMLLCCLLHEGFDTANIL